MKRKRFAVAGLGLVLAFLLIGLAAAQGPYHLDWYVVSGGGGPMTSDNYIMRSTAGQGGIGLASSDNYGLSAGYWYARGAPAGEVISPIYLPIILKSYP
jgi:hypothetical protein